MSIYCLIHHFRGDDGDPCEIEVLGVSQGKSALKARLEELVAPFERSLTSSASIERQNVEVMRAYLQANRGAIDGFEHKGEPESKKDNTITFLANNWSYSLPDFAGSNSFVRAYCNVSTLSRPFPAFKNVPMTHDFKEPVYLRSNLSIKKGRVL